jgi:Asp-tRNA(Asn)/Glu-tRNA(Gln) amidotransferase A subunit family amidase
VELGRLVRERAISPVELIDAHLRRIEAINSKKCGDRDGFGLMDDEVVATVGRAAEALAKEGHVIEPVQLAILQEADWTEPAVTLWSTQTPAYLAPLVEGRLNELSPVGARQIGRARPSADQYAVAYVERLRSAFAGYFSR